MQQGVRLEVVSDPDLGIPMGLARGPFLFNLFLACRPAPPHPALSFFLHVHVTPTD